MPKVESHPHGAPAWADLATSDPAGAKAFYTAMFGWESSDVSPSENMVYTMYTKNGGFVAASFKDDPSMSGDAPPRWQVHVKVDDVDAVVEKVKSAGGNIYAGPFDVSDSGRVAAVSDAQGAFFMLWQPKAHAGAGLMNEPGSLVWFELNTSDSDAAAEFYKAALGCSASNPDLTPPYTNYTMLSIDGVPRAGVIQMSADWGNMPPHWRIYLGVEDIEASRAKVVELGGENVMDTMEMAQGKLSLVKDPQGAYFSLFEQNA